jgi:hypothetical protein
MSHLILNPTCNALMERLREADRQRDHLRAQLADAAMVAEMEQVERNLPWGLTGEKRAEVKAEREAAIRKRIAVRAERRANEMRIFGSYTRPGTWDKDLDAYQEPRYEEEVEGGYRIRLVRARDLTWNAYVILPAGHCAAGRHYDFFGGYETPQGLSLPPQNLTYNAMEEERGVFGFYLTGVVKPREDYGDYTKDNFYSVEKTGYSPFADNGSVHVDYAEMKTRCIQLVDYFKELATDPKAAAICRSAVRCATHGHGVGGCEGCVEERRQLEAPQQTRYGTLDAATGVYTPQTREEFGKELQADIARAVAPKKKSWAAVAGGK